MHTEQRTEEIVLDVVHVNVGPEFTGAAFDLQKYLNEIEAGYNNVIDNRIELIVASDNLVVYGAPYVNAYAKHYCLIGQATQTYEQWVDSYSRGELDLLAESLAEDCLKYRLAPRRLSVSEVQRQYTDRSIKGICGHIDVTDAFKERGRNEHPPVILDHWDPGPNFPWVLLLNHVQAILGASNKGDDVLKPTDLVDAALNSRLGRYLLQADGGVANYGDAGFYGSYPGLKGQSPLVMGKNHAVSIVITPSGKGYWILCFDGSIYTFGDAGYFKGFQKEFISGGFLKLEPWMASYKAIRNDGVVCSPR